MVKTTIHAETENPNHIRDRYHTSKVVSTTSPFLKNHLKNEHLYLVFLFFIYERCKGKWRMLEVRRDTGEEQI